MHANTTAAHTFMVDGAERPDQDEDGQDVDAQSGDERDGDGSNGNDTAFIDQR